VKPRDDHALVPLAHEAPRSNALALVQGGRLVPARDPEERTADGYLRLTAHLLLEAERHGFRTVGVFSALSGEGKTTAAINLAASLGRARGREGRVLLVDGDTRGRMLTRLLCGENAAQSPRAVLTATSFESVDLLTAPAPTGGPSVRAPAAWVRTLQDLSARYPQVVIDCPAVLADPEGVVLRECVEALVLVVEVGHTTRKAVERAVGSVGRRVVGVILNGSDETHTARSTGRKGSS
jgi:Mrp family chromosome partitioning ATPase